MVQIRQGHEADCQAVLAVLQAAFAPYQERLDPPSGVTTETVQSLQQKLASHTLLIAETDGRLVGCVLFTPHRHHAEELYFGRLAVLPAYQKRGIAHMLVGRVEQYGREHGFQQVRLGVRVALPDNVRFFQSLGYQISAEGRHEGYDHATYYHMSKSLAPLATD